MKSIIYNLHNIRTPITGIGRYTIELLRGSLNSNINASLAYGGKLFSQDSIESLLEKLELQSVQAKTDWRKIVGKIPFSRELYRQLDGIRFSKLMFQQLQDGAIYHDLNYSPCATANLSVSTIYDLSFIRFPETHPRHRVQFLKKYLNKLVANKQSIITISNSIKTELVTDYQIDENCIHVTHLAADESYYPRSEAECASILNHYGLKYKEFILSVCTLEPRKNLNRVVDAFCKLKPSLQQAYPLVIVGMRGWKSSQLESKINRLQKQGLIIRLGFVPQSDLPKLYSSAKIFIYPSLYEGFGLPLLEAMQSGCACLTSNTGALAEVSNNNAFQIDPLSTDDIINGMERLLIDSNLNSHHEKIGQARSKDFSWARTISQTHQIYNEL